MVAVIDAVGFALVSCDVDEGVSPLTQCIIVLESR